MATTDPTSAAPTSAGARRPRKARVRRLDGSTASSARRTDGHRFVVASTARWSRL